MKSINKKATLKRMETRGTWCVSYEDLHDTKGLIIEKIYFKKLKEARFFAKGFNMGWQKCERRFKALNKSK